MTNMHVPLPFRRDQCILYTVTFNYGLTHTEIERERDRKTEIERERKKGRVDVGIENCSERFISFGIARACIDNSA